MRTSFLCLACGYQLFKDDITATKILALPGPYRILTCCKCRLSRLEPALTTEQMTAIYGADYFSISKPGKDFKEIIGVDVELAPLPNYTLLSGSRIPKFRWVIDEMKAMNSHGKTILDIGSGTGDFVRTAGEEGLDAMGVELSAEAAQEARVKNINVVNGTIWTIDKQFDFLHLNHVFEHFSDPLKELERLKKLMSDNAVMYIQVPYQFNSVERMKTSCTFLSKKPQCSILSFHHPYMYTPKSITLMLKRAGFKIVRKRIFDPRRYEAVGFFGGIKKYIWRIMSTFNIGIDIEVFAKL